MNDKIKSLESQLNSLPPSDSKSYNRIDLLNVLAWEIGLIDPDRSRALTEEAMQLSRELNYEKGIAYSTRNIGYWYLLATDLKDARETICDALQRFRALGEKKGEATALDIMSFTYWRLGSYDKALDYALQCLELNKEIKYQRGVAWALHNIASIHFDLGDSDKAITHFQQSLEIFEEISYASGIGQILGSLGEVYQRNGDLDTALTFYRRSLEQQKKARLPLGIVRRYTSLGSIYQEKKDYKQAFKYYDKALALFNEVPNKEVQAYLLIKLGSLYAELENTSDGLKVLHKALALVEGTEAKPSQISIHKSLCEMYESSGDLKNALNHFKIFHQLKEAVFNEDSSRKLRNLEIRMEVEKAEEEAEIHRLRYIELAEMQAHLVQSEKSALLGKIAAGIAHEVNTPVGIINSNADVSRRAIDRALSAIGQQIQDSSPPAQADLKKTIRILKINNLSTLEAGQKIAEMIRSLKNFVRLDQADLQLADVHEGIEDTLTLISRQFADHITVNKTFGDIPRILCYPQQLNQVFMTLLINAGEAIEHKGEININTSNTTRHVFIKISDTGKGLSPEQLDSIFEIGFSARDKKMRMNVGLANCYNIIQKHHGSITVESELKKGTTFTIELPANLTKISE